MLEAPVHLWNPHVGCSIQHKMDHSDEAFSGPRNTCLTKKKQPQDQPGHGSTTVPQGIIQQLLECVALKLSSNLLMLHVECYLDPQFPSSLYCMSESMGQLAWHMCWNSPNRKREEAKTMQCLVQSVRAVGCCETWVHRTLSKLWLMAHRTS